MVSNDPAQLPGPRGLSYESGEVTWRAGSAAADGSAWLSASNRLRQDAGDQQPHPLARPVGLHVDLCHLHRHTPGPDRSTPVVKELADGRLIDRGQALAGH